MPWCPKCKMEYVSGITTCSDCNVLLEEEMNEEVDMVSFLESKKEQLASKFVDFLKFSKIQEVEYRYDDEKELFVVFVAKDLLKQVKKLYQAFYNVESELVLASLNDKDKEQSSISHDEATEMFDEDVSKDYSHNSSMFDQDEIRELYEGKSKLPEKTTTYVKKEEQYNDLKSSALTFLIVSMVGIILLILNIVGVLDFLQGIIPLTVMGLTFIIFLLIGISSYKKAMVVCDQIDEENKTTDMINNFLLEHVTIDDLDAKTNPNDSDEIRFYQKIEYLKELVNAQFGELDDSYLERILEEYYNNHLESI